MQTSAEEVEKAVAEELALPRQAQLHALLVFQRLRAIAIDTDASAILSRLFVIFLKRKLNASIVTELPAMAAIVSFDEAIVQVVLVALEVRKLQTCALADARCIGRRCDSASRA